MDSQAREWAEIFFELTPEQRQELISEMRKRIRAKGERKESDENVHREEIGSRRQLG